MIKKLSASIGEYKLDTILTPTFVSLEVILEIIIPLLMADLIDRGIDAGNLAEVRRMGLWLLACAVCMFVMGALSGRSAAIASGGFAKNLRRRMFYSVQDFSFSNIDKFSTASIVTRLTTDVTNVQQAFQMIIRMAVRSPLMLIFSLVACLRINAQLSLIFLLIIPVLGVGLYFIMSRTHPIFERVFRTYDRLNNVVQEDVRGIRVVKAFLREDYETEKFENISGEICRDFTRAEKNLAYNMPLMQLCMYTGLLLISWFGARLIVSTQGTAFTTGELMSLISYAIQILMSLMMLSFVFVMIVISRSSAERITELLDEKSDLVDGEAHLRTVADGSVRFEDVTFRYARKADKPVLDHVDLFIPSGQTVGILGGTGSSKSSLVQLIPRLYDAAGGRVLVGGHDVRDYDLDALRDQVAVVLQKNVLFSGTVAENLRWGNPDATDEQLREACRLACADEFIDKMPQGYDTMLEQGGANVSGGQKQRLCIARALLKKPRILILDDSTSAVDTRTDARIRDAFAKYIPETTKIIIAQRVASVMDADQILIMDDGRIVERGTHAELMQSSAIYREVYQSQQKGGEDDE